MKFILLHLEKSSSSKEKDSINNMNEEDSFEEDNQKENRIENLVNKSSRKIIQKIYMKI